MVRGAFLLQLSITVGGHMNDDDTAEEVYAVIGTVVARLLKPDQYLTLHEIASALHSMGEASGTAGMRESCERAVRLLAQQMH